MEIQPANDDEGQQAIQIVTAEEFSKLVESYPRKWQPGSRQCLIHGVPPHLRARRQPNKHVYEPEVISLGPYHHGKPELHEAEGFKYLSLDWFALGEESKKLDLYNKVLEKIDGIRACYADITIVEKYDDKRLALMMLLDASFIINLMVNCTEMSMNNQSDWLGCRGMAASIQIMISDVFVLENQIPLQVIELLMSLQDNERVLNVLGVEVLVRRFLRWTMKVSRNKFLYETTDESGQPPIHILDVCWREFVEIPSRFELKDESEWWLITKTREFSYNKLPKFWIMVGIKFKQIGASIISIKKWWPRFLRRNRESVFEDNVFHTSCRSVMDLKANGIHFKPSRTHSVVDVTFKSNALYGELKLPIQYVSPQTQVVLSNLIAYEVSPNSLKIPVVLAYVIFMKSLIESPADVKELQRKGILMNSFTNHEQVVKMFGEIDTFGFGDLDIFEYVKRKVEEHCRSRAKTWIADLIHTRFQNPWSAVALCAALLLLILTFLQAWYTIHPVK